jgi:hypothetical protein
MASGLEVEAMNALEVGLYAMRVNVQSAVGRAPIRVGTAV